MLNSLDLEGRPEDTRVVVAMLGRGRFLGDGGAPEGRRLRRRRGHAPALRPRRGDPPQGRDAAPSRNIHDARTVAERIGIPHYVLDYESRFKETVIDPFAASYVAGETPVPCVHCNMSIKFKDRPSTARDLGARVLATGHYVASRPLPGGGRALYRAREAERDQSYFLFATTPEQLDFLRFPAWRPDQGGDARAGAALRLAGRRQARQPGHLLRADRPLHRHRRAIAAG